MEPNRHPIALSACRGGACGEDTFRQIQADSGNLHGEWLLCSSLPDSKLA
jgi:hypothetical protein